MSAKVQISMCIPVPCSSTYTTVSINSVSGQRRPKSTCANAQADLGLRCPQTAKGSLYIGNSRQSHEQTLHCNDHLFYYRKKQLQCFFFSFNL